jgi:hypothetical protein
MKTPNRSRSVSRGRSFLEPIVPLLITGCLWASSPYQLEPTQIIAAFILAYFPSILYRRWQDTERLEFPLLVFITTMYWLAYALPLFWGEREVSYGVHNVSDVSITKSMYLAVEGVAALFLGAHLLPYFSQWSPRVKIDLPRSGFHRHYLGIALIGGTLLRILVPIDQLGSGARQLLSSVETTVPSLAFGLLFRYWLRGEATRWNQLLVVGYLFGSVVLGIASGWLGNVVAIGIVCVTIYAYERRKLPVAALAVILPVLLFFQPAKSGFRERYWYVNTGATVSERVWFWLGDSWRMWSQALDDPGDQRTRELAYQVFGRLSLLEQTANVVEFTPSVVPYQYFKLYSYLGLTFVPRFIWQDKPSVNDANRWYQVSYHLTSPKHLDNVSIAVGALTESYISFGWFGPLLIMLPLGMLLALFQRLFLRADRGLVFSTLGAVLIPPLLAVESQLAVYLAGVIQQIALALLVLSPVLHLYKSTSAGSRTAETFRLVRLKPRNSGAANPENVL